MPFKKGDININRSGRPKNAEPELLRQALIKEGQKRGIEFWDKVAEFAFTDRNVMIAIIKKFVADKHDVNLEGDGIGSHIAIFEGLSDKELRGVIDFSRKGIS